MPPDPSPAPAVDARTMLATPAILLIVTGALGIPLALLGMVRRSAGIPPELLNNPDLAKFAPLLRGAQTGGIFTNILGLAISAFIIYGAVKMKAVQSYGLAMAASIVAMIPCGGCCCIGLPVGIWCLVLLNKPEIKAAFQG
jgi:hypothetical protein